MASLTGDRFRPARLLKVAAEAGIRDTDPLYLVMDEMEVMTDHLRKLPEQCQAKFDTLDRRLTAVLEKSETLAGGHLARQDAAELPAAIDRLMLVKRWWLVIIVGVLLAGAVCLGYWYGERRRDDQLVQIGAGLERALTRRDAEIWLALMRLNDVQLSLANCRVIPQATGGEACSFVFWTRSPPPPPGR